MDKVAEHKKLGIFIHTVELSEVPGLIGAIKEVVHIINPLDIYEEDNQLRMKKTEEDLFEKICELQLRKTNNVSVFRTERGSIYLFASKNPSDERGISIRFELSANGEYYIVHYPTRASSFESRHIESRIPRVGYSLNEVTDNGKLHISTPIVDIDI